jgi:hypothetical protein
LLPTVSVAILVLDVASIVVPDEIVVEAGGDRRSHGATVPGAGSSISVT